MIFYLEKTEVSDDIDSQEIRHADTSDVILTANSSNEAAKIIGVKEHVLRFWEQNIPLARPEKIGRRKFYSEEKISILFRVKSLVIENGFKVSAVQRNLKSQENREKQNCTKEKTVKEECVRETIDDLRTLHKIVLKALEK